MAVLLAVAAAVVLLVARTGTQTTVTPESTTTERTTLLETEGPSVLIVLAIPVVLATAGAATLIWSRSRSAALTLSVLLTIFCVLGAASIGLFFLPAALALGVGVLVSRGIQCGMTQVSIRDLRNHGGDVIDRVAAGERITITRSGKPVAELRPIRQGLTAEVLLERWARLPYVDPAELRADIDSILDPSL